MKAIIAVVLALVAMAVAEPPLSRSYLPPPPGRTPSQGQAFEAGPEVVVARSLEAQGSRGGQTSGRDIQDTVQGSGLSRNTGTPQARFGSQGYDKNAAAYGRNALDENNESANYNFGYMVNDQGTEFGHHEERQEERAQGEYHVVLPDGKRQTVNYEADERGFKPQISYQDTHARSGYDGNAQPLRGYGDHGSIRTGDHRSTHSGDYGTARTGYGNNGSPRSGHGDYGSARPGYEVGDSGITSSGNNGSGRSNSFGDNGHVRSGY